MEQEASISSQQIRSQVSEILTFTLTNDDLENLPAGVITHLFLVGTM